MERLYGLDQELFRTIHQGWQRAWLDPIFWAFSYLGLTQVQVLLTLPLLVIPRARYCVLPLITACLASGILSQVFKRLIHRERPSNLEFSVPQEAWLANSFPSGHTTTSFAIATMILLLTQRSRFAYLGPLALVVALLIGMSRIYRGVHWPTDVAMGACVGSATSVLVYFALDRLGKTLHLDQPAASLTGRETLEES